LGKIFLGSRGIRAGWRLLIYCAIFAALAVPPNLAAIRMLHVHLPVTTLSPSFVLVGDLLIFIPMMIAAYIMSRIERRPMGDYGLPLRRSVARGAGFGALVGFVSFTIMITIIWAAGGVRFGAVTLAPHLALDGLVFLLGTITVGLSEEFLFRGYAQFTLAQGIGFWPAALLLSLGFAASHVGNPGETFLGIVQVAIFGLVFCFVLWRTGNLWFAVGYHAAWDWTESFVYGVPDSGHHATTSLLHGTMLGPVWLSGGSDGPEASVLALIALLLVPVVVACTYRFQGSLVHER
jgi:uncharacterized protein